MSRTNITAIMLYTSGIHPSCRHGKYLCVTIPDTDCATHLLGSTTTVSCYYFFTIFYFHCSSEEDDADWSGEDLSDNDRSWAELARSYSKQLKKRLKREEREYGDDSDSDTPTIGASDADYETDTETEEYENGKGAWV